MNDVVFDKVIKEHFDTSDRKSIRTLLSLNEADQNQAMVALASKLYENIVAKVDDIDFGTIPASKGDITKIGNFVEVKNSNVGVGTKLPHLTYIGDSDIGAGVNMGCGCITVNYDGKKKHRTVVEDNVFVGCNTNLVAPVTVKQGAYIGAGSTITKEVPENALGIGRAKQKNIEGWAEKQRQS